MLELGCELLGMLELDILGEGDIETTGLNIDS